MLLALSEVASVASASPALSGWPCLFFVWTIVDQRQNPVDQRQNNDPQANGGPTSTTPSRVIRCRSQCRTTAHCWRDSRPWPTPLHWRRGQIITRTFRIRPHTPQRSTPCPAATAAWRCHCRLDRSLKEPNRVLMDDIEVVARLSRLEILVHRQIYVLLYNSSRLGIRTLQVDDLHSSNIRLNFLTSRASSLVVWYGSPSTSVRTLPSVRERCKWFPSVYARLFTHALFIFLFRVGHFVSTPVDWKILRLVCDIPPVDWGILLLGIPVEFVWFIVTQELMWTNLIAYKT